MVTNMLNVREINILTLPKVAARLPLTFYSSLIQAGFPSPAEDYAEGELDLNTFVINNPPATFFVRVTGDSMINAGIFPGDILVVDRSAEATTGKVIIAVLNGEFTVKRFKVDKSGKAALLPENPKYPPILLNEEIDFRIWGVVTAVVRKV